ncbi:MAG TPA: prolyl oligopeptidase family serine peptidase [Dehalococcoidia bacterium]|nr:prolyl oligopeptidase family serine peptidase [Dehalococcoidia bacterium]
MSEARVAPYGSWKSPITTDLIVGQTMGLGRIVLDGDVTYWVEHRPWEEGRSVIVRRTPDGETADVTPAGYGVGTRVHEYGTRGYTVADGVVYFSNFADQRLYRQRPGEAPIAITPEGDARYGGMIVDRRRNRITCVREDHSTEDEQAVNEIVAIDCDGEGKIQVLVTSNDFYSSPRLSPDGATFAWVTWNHPNMPWDGTELWVSSVTAGGLLETPTQVAGGIDEAVMQPEWSPDGTLYFLSDRSGWANLHRWPGGPPELVLEMEADFAKTHWWLGMSSYGFESESSIICCYVHNGMWTLARLHLEDRRLEPFDIPYTELGRGDLQVACGRVVFEAGSPVKHLSVLEVDLAEGSHTVLQVSIRSAVELGYVSIPEEIECPTGNGLTAHAFYYAPRNQDFVAPEGEKPPLMVLCHGGPHDSASIQLNLTTQYWTSRGIGVLDVNYGGSTGYGRDYRERLIGEWGIVDVDDSVNAAKFLIERGDVDENRVVISGGSAGGYTALAAMTFRDVFKAGASHFGISDLEALLTDIHKFDTFSLVGLVGPYPLYRKRYFERSPINYAEELNCPVIFFQGLEDTIVPADQSEAMYKVVRERGIPTAYVSYEGEYHGFTQAENIKRTLEAEIYFYSRIFGFELADDIRPVRIENLKGAPGSLRDRLHAARDLVPRAFRDGHNGRVQKLLAAVRDAVPKRDR